ncbi:MAG: hypothetical protein ACXAD7_05405 [Candidatus Kariarchaeaceae archaeon]|jgi:hypothetical protein
MGIYHLVNSSILTLSGIVAIVVLVYLLKSFATEKKIYHYYWAISFLMHSVFVALILIYSYEILEEPLSQFFASFIPIGIAVGLYFAIWEDKNYGLYFIFIELIALVFIAISTFELAFTSNLDLLIALAHAPAGLSITILPLYTALVGKTSLSSIYITISGVFISVRGCIMTSFKLYDPLTSVFDEDVSHSILPGFFIIAGLFLILGISRPSQWKVELPYLSRENSVPK